MIQRYTMKMPAGNKTPNVSAVSTTGLRLRTKKKKETEDVTDPLYHYKRASEDAKEDYERAGKRLKADTDESLRRASVSYELLKKYLPIENERAGLSGLGVSESTGIEAHNAYRKRVHEIESRHDENQAALDSAYKKERETLSNRYFDAQKAQSAEALEREGLERSAQNSVYKAALEVIKDEKFNSLEELDELLSGVKPHVRDEQYATLAYYVNYYKNNPDFIDRDRAR